MTTPHDSLNYHVIDIDLQVFLYLVGEDNIHEALVGGVNVLKDERHDIIMIVVMIRHEGSFRSVYRIHLNLVVP